MSRLIALARVAGLVGATLFLCTALLVARTAARLSGGTPRDRDALTDDYVGRWARTTKRLIGMRIQIDGDLPRGPVALVANHLSYIDIVALWCVIPGVFVARADVAEWPLIGWAGRSIGTIFIDRTRKRDLLSVLPEMRRPLADGRNVIFFPEGTSSRGEEVLPFKSSLFEAAVRADVPVVGVSIEFETAPPAESADWSICWWADMTFAPHAFALLHLPGFETRLRFSSPIQTYSTHNDHNTHDAREGHTGWKRKELCHLSQEAVEKIFNPTGPAR